MPREPWEELLIPAPSRALTILEEPSRAPPSRLTGLALMILALALGVVGLTINAWFAQSLGATDFAGWLFMAVGLASDGAALALPAHAAGLWSAGSRVACLVAWLLWTLTFAFALVSSVGFASLNIADTTAARASRPTSAITLAERTADTLSRSREDECKRRGDRCRELEALERAALADLASAQATASRSADPQARSAAELIAWLTPLRPSGDDMAKFRLALLTLLPQLGGLLLMVARR